MKTVIFSKIRNSKMYYLLCVLISVVLSCGNGNGDSASSNTSGGSNTTADAPNENSADDVDSEQTRGSLIDLQAVAPDTDSSNTRAFFQHTIATVEGKVGGGGVLTVHCKAGFNVDWLPSLEDLMAEAGDVLNESQAVVADQIQKMVKSDASKYNMSDVKAEGTMDITLIYNDFAKATKKNHTLKLYAASEGMFNQAKDENGQTIGVIGLSLYHPIAQADYQGLKLQPTADLMRKYGLNEKLSDANPDNEYYVDMQATGLKKAYGFDHAIKKRLSFSRISPTKYNRGEKSRVVKIMEWRIKDDNGATLRKKQIQDSIKLSISGDFRTALSGDYKGGFVFCLKMEGVKDTLTDVNSIRRYLVGALKDGQAAGMTSDSVSTVLDKCGLGRLTSKEKDEITGKDKQKQTDRIDNQSDDSNNGSGSYTE